MIRVVLESTIRRTTIGRRHVSPGGEIITIENQMLNKQGNTLEEVNRNKQMVMEEKVVTSSTREGI